MNKNHLYNENCLDTMQKMPENYIDFVITSPPYDEIRNYNRYKFMNRTKEKKVGNVFFYSVGGGISTKDKIAFQHPAIFPEKLVIDQRIIQLIENEIRNKFK